MKRRWIVAGVFAVLLLAAAGASYTLIFTEAGLSWLVARVDGFLPGESRLGTPGGTLKGPLRLNGLFLDTPGAQVEADKVEVEWQLAALLRGTVDVTVLRASGVRVRVPQSAPDDKAPAEISLPVVDLPVAIELHDVEIDDLAIFTAGRAEPLQVDRLSFRAATEDGGAVVEALDVQGPRIALKGSLAYAPRSAAPLETRLDGRFEPDGFAPLDFTISATSDGGKSDVQLALAPPYALTMDGGLSGFPMSPEWQADIRLDAASPQGINPAWPVTGLSGTARLSGDFGAAAGTLDLRADALEYGGVTLRGGVNAAGRSIELDDMQLGIEDGPGRVAVSGTAEIGDSVWPRADFAGTWQALRWPPNGDETAQISPEGTFRLQGGEDEYRLEFRGALGAPGATGSLQGLARIEPQAEPLRFEADVGWTGLQVNLAEGQALASTGGKIQARGNIDAYTVAMDGALSFPPWVNGPVQLAGRGNRESLQIDTLAAPVLAGTLRGDGKLTWAQPRGIVLTLRGSDIDPGQIAPEWNGALGFELALDASIVAEQPQADLRIDTLSGRLRDQPLSGSGRLFYSAAGWGVERIDVRLGGAVLAASGKIAQNSDLAWRLDVPDLALAVPGYAGRLKSEGRVSGSREHLQVVADLEAGDFSGAGILLAEATASANLDLSNAQASNLVATARGLEVASQRISELNLRADGRASNHAAVLEVVAEAGRVDLRVSGALRGARDWAGRIDALTVAPAKPAGEWSLAAPAAVSVDATQAELGSVCLGREDRSLCARGAWRADEFATAGIELKSLPLADLQAFLPPALKYGGDISGDFSFRSDAAGARGDGKLAVSPGDIRQTLEDEEIVLLAWRDANASTGLENDLLILRGKVDLEGSGFADVSFDVPMQGLQPDRSGNLQAHLGAELTALPILSVLIPDISRLRGNARVDLDVAGTLDRPEISGSGRLVDGAAEIPRLGIELLEVNATLNGSGDTLSLDGGARSGDGSVRFEGRYELRGEEWSGRTTLQGEDFLAVALPEVRAEVSPDISLDVQGHKLNLEGKVAVPRARVEPRDLSGTVQATPDEVLISDDDAGPRGERWTLRSKVRLQLGDEVEFKGFGLSGRVTGEVLAVDVPDQLTTGTGELQVMDGEYRAYGRVLAVERGRLLFSGGPIASPGLDIRASRAIDDVSVGVDIRGTLKRPELVLFSTPSMSQSDALAYLVLGRPVSDVQGSDQSVLNDAASSLGLSGAAYLARQVGRRIGLDEVNIESSDETDAALVVGKYLSPKLYVSYGLGLFEAFNTLLLRYQLSPRVSVQTETGTVSSADIFYTIER